jgi:hypothetical protein
MSCPRCGHPGRGHVPGSACEARHDPAASAKEKKALNEENPRGKGSRTSKSRQVKQVVSSRALKAKKAAFKKQEKERKKRQKEGEN